MRQICPGGSHLNTPRDSLELHSSLLISGALKQQDYQQMAVVPTLKALKPFHFQNKVTDGKVL